MSLWNCYYVWVILRLDKLTSLPNVEITREQEHARKVWADRDGYDLMQDKQHKLIYPRFSGDSWNSILSINKYVTILIKSGQSFINSIIETELNESGKSSAKCCNAKYRSTTGLPKEGNLYGNGGFIVSLQNSFCCRRKGIQNFRTYKTAATENSLSEHESGTELLSIMKRDKRGRYTRLYKLICQKELLLAGYNKIKSNPGNLTPGTDGKTLDGIDMKWFEKIIQELKSESFKFTSVKRILIPKKNGKLRPLGIPNIRDKIVQQAMLMILEQIYEPIFSNLSFGFRPNRSTHSALREISHWNGTTWAIEGDIKGFFDNINHNRLVKLLCNKINDQQFIDLIWKLLRAGYLEGNSFKVSSLGVPQGGIVSPMLSNIYLHEFDIFMENIIENRSSKVTNISKVNPEMTKFSAKLGQLNDLYQVNKDKEILKEIRKIRSEHSLKPSRIRTGVRIRYVRYADDWVVGIIGPKSLAIQLKQEIANFLKENLELELSSEKTLITHLTSKKARFLGVLFFIQRKTVPGKVVWRKIRDNIVPSRVNHSRIIFHMPTLEILENLQDKGFIKNKIVNGKQIKVPNAITKWIFLDHRSIILRYNSVINGIYSYYSFVDNKTQIWSIINLFLKHSCAKTLSRKFNLHSRAQAFKKFGSYLTAPIMLNKKTIGLNIRNTYKRKANDLNKSFPITYDPLESLNWRLRTQISILDPCWICGSENNIQMHHVKHIRKGGIKSSGFLALMSQLNRKQIPVCQSCHVKIHKGLYNDISIKNIKRPANKYYIIKP